MNDHQVGQPTSSSERPASNVSERQGKLWHSLGEIYGARWVRENGEAPGTVWKSMINGLTDNEIKHALALLVKQPRKDGRGNIHPPQAPEFWEAAKAGQSRYVAVTDQSRDISKYGRGANKVLLRLIMQECGVGEEFLQPLLKLKAQVVMDFEMIASEEEVEWKHFIKTVDERLRSLLKDLKEAAASLS